ncbi:MAG: efflux RND transporter permease subunit [Planctomycetes bacterium]|nr:efflux RND transporter permease subunit [Planctomycetota bacterium]
MFRKLAEVSVTNPVAVHLLSLLLLVAGVYAYLTMPREIFPDFTRNRLLVTTAFLGASPEDIEELITVKIEDAADSIDGVETIESTSMEGVSLVDVYLRRGTNVDRALTDLDRALATVTGLPDDAEEPVATEIKTQFPVITLSIYGELDELALKDLIRPIQRAMEDIPGVGNVRPSGLRDVQWLIEVDPEAVDAFGVSLAEIADALAAHNLSMPGGFLERARDEVVLRTKGEAKTAQAIERIVVRAQSDGAHVRVSDVARVRPGFERAKTYGRFNGKPALNLTALKDPDGNILEISQAVKELSKQLQLPAGVSADVHTDLSVFLESRLQTMQNNALSGFFLVMVSLCVLLNWRMAILVALGIPLAFLFSFLGMSFLGYSINMMSLFALILILGMLVDDAIIVTENIFRLIEEGVPPTRAAIQGTAEVARPVLSTMLTTVSAFMPMLLVEGEMGQWMAVVPIVVTLCLVGSLIECFVILPCHVAEFAEPQHAPEDTRFARFLPRYEGWVRAALRNRYVLIAAVLGGSLLLVTWASTQLKFVLFGEFESDTYFLNFELPTTTPLEETARETALLEAAVLEIPEGERRAAVTNVGLSAVDFNRIDRGSYLGQVVVNFSQPEERERSAIEIIDELRERVQGYNQFTKLDFKGLQAGPGGAAIEVGLEAEDYDKLLVASRELQAWLREQTGVQDVYDDWAPGKSELEVRIHEEAAAALGLDTRNVAMQIRNAFQGNESTTVRRFDEDVELVVRFPPGARSRRASLEDLWLTTPSGERVPFDAVARAVEGRGLSKILRSNRQRSITVLANVDVAKANAIEVTEQLQQRFQRSLARDYGVNLRIKGQRREAEKSMGGLIQGFFLSLLLIYFILGTQFRSFLQPFFVMVAIPFGIDGILVGHVLFGADVSFMSMMGLVATSGIVVNDSLVLVDLVNRLREEGVPTFEAAVAGSVRRLRAILLTSATTVFGLAPLAFFASGQAKFLSPMAMSIVFGLLFATGLTLVVIPCLYLILEDLKRASARLLGRAPAADSPPSAIHASSPAAEPAADSEPAPGEGEGASTPDDPTKLGG